MNKVLLMGRLTKEPELKYVGDNIPICNFSIAVDRKYKKDGQKETDFFNCVAWRKQAEFFAKYFTKGQRVLVEGCLQNRTWDDNDGNKRYATDIQAESVYFADGKKDTSYGMGQGQSQIDMPPGYDEALAAGEDDLPF